jgi:hypothetical protein
MPERRWISLLTRLAGAVLFVVPLVPILAIFGPTLGAGALVPPSEWLLGILVFAAAAWVVALLLSSRADTVYGALAWLSRRISPRGALLGGLTALAGILTSVGWLAFRHRPHLVDSIAQMFQARAFAAGTVKVPAFEPAAFFALPHVILDPAGWYAQYPPGHAALLAVGVKAGAAWIVPVLLSLGTFALLVLLTRRIFGRDEARVTALLLLACPFFWVMGASLMNHVSALFFVALFLYAFARWESEGLRWWIALAAAALGGVFLSRPWDAITIGAPFAFLGLGIAYRRRDVAGPLVGAVTFLAIASLYLAFNAATTGDPFVPGYITLWGESHGLGFHVSPWGEAHTPWTGLRNELIDLALLDVFLFEWPIPALWPAALFLLAGREVGRWDRRLMVGLLAFPIAYFFYWHRDAFLGPRFLYPSVAFAVPLTARAVVVGVRRLRGRRFGLPGLFKPADGGLCVLALAGLCLVYATGYSIPQRMRVYASGLRSMKVDLLAAAREAGIDRGIVFVATSWGDRMLARLYGAGVSADLVEQVYRHADHCELAGVIDRADGLPASRLEAALRDLMRGPAAPRLGGGINGDVTLRLVPGRPLAPACIEEIEYDRRGFTIYPPHVLANDMPVGDALVIVRDLRARNGELTARHPGLRAYRYRPGGFTALPERDEGVEWPTPGNPRLPSE